MDDDLEQTVKGLIEANIDLPDAAASSWDVIVVGAGPAGAMAARQLGQQGFRVLLLDRCHFPRDKVCGGCLNRAVFEMLQRVGLGQLPERLRATSTKTFQLMAMNQQVQLKLPGAVAVSRRALDAELVREAIRTGVAFLPGCSVSQTKCVGELRRVEVSVGKIHASLRARIVLAADGVGGAVGHGNAQDQVVARRSYIGLNAMSDGFRGSYDEVTVYMACGRRGYVGMVRVEQGRLNIAAAMDPQWIKQTGAAHIAIESIINEAGAPPIDGLGDLKWRGTNSLTRKGPLPAQRRLFVIGDAAGYVEPFTGEGMAWAIGSALLIMPIVTQALDRWDDRLVNQWRRSHRSAFAWRCRRCRAIALALRRPTLLACGMNLLRWMPGATLPLVRSIHSTPATPIPGEGGGRS